jgi:hypothetical protein
MRDAESNPKMKTSPELDKLRITLFKLNYYEKDIPSLILCC